jgi:hypothetical protein
MARVTYQIEIPVETVARLLRPEAVPKHATLNRWQTRIVGGDQRDPAFEELVAVYEWEEED